MTWKLLSETFDRIMGLRRYMVEGSPVIRDQISGLEPVEQGQGIVGGEVSFPEA